MRSSIVLIRKAREIKMARQSVGSFTSSNGSVDASFSSLASASSSGSSSYELESEVGREALREICCSALSRLLDFPGSQLETLLGFDEEQEGRGSEEGGINVARNIAASFRMMRQSIGSGISRLTALSQRHHHFRQSLQELREDSPDGPPTLKFGAPLSSNAQVIILQLITHMECFTSHEGFFRKPGSRNRVDQFIQELGEKELSDIISNQVYKPQDFASVLKQYFSELPEPLLLKRHMEAYLQASALSSPAATSKCLQLLMLLLPPSHRVVLQHLLELLSQTASHLQSKMDANNLALVFAPTLFLTSTQELFPSEVLEKLTSLLKYMIERCEEIFEVPAEVQVVAERYCKKKSRAQSQDEDIPLEMYSTYCKQICPDNFHATGRETAMAEVASLYEYIQKMPDGPQKTHFLKRFESGSKIPGTPTSYVKPPKSHKNKENFTTPRLKKVCQGIGSSQLSKRTRSCFKKGFLTPGNLLEELEQCETPKIKASKDSQSTNKRLRFHPMITQV